MNIDKTSKKRRQFSWTVKQVDKLNKVKDILVELKDYLPLTLRQIYYQLVGKGYIDNKRSEYGMLSKLVKQARIDGYISWDHIEDRVRVFSNGAGYLNKEEFINTQFENFLKEYYRDLMQSQGKQIEVWIEKDALASIFRKVCLPYCISVVVCRGFSSASFLHDYKVRVDDAPNKQPVMLYFGDFDPSGMEMLESMKITLKEELRVRPVVFKRIALLKDDIFKYKLPHNPNALKRTDTRAEKHLEQYGDLAVELDALPPKILTEKIKEAIISELDIHLLNQEIEKNRQDNLFIENVRNEAMRIIKK